MTPELWTAVLAGIGTVLSAFGVRSIVIKGMELWFRWSGDGRTLAEQRAARTEQLDQDERKRLWARVEELEKAARLSDDHHDQEIREVRKELAKVQFELAETKVAAAMNEAERQNALRLYTEVLQAMSSLKAEKAELQLQVAALTAENATLRRQLPAPQDSPA